MRQIIYRMLIGFLNIPFISAALLKFSHSKWSRPAIRPYARFYKINQAEMKGEIGEHQNLHAFFTRELKEGLRPIDEKTETVISPVDGVMEDFGTIEGKTKTIIVKGKNYSISEMLGSETKAKEYEDGQYMVLYLSPSHYHRIHSPVTGDVSYQQILGKKSFPVNRLGLKYGKETLSKNYRIVTELQCGSSFIAVVKVGAMFINSIVVTKQDKHWQKGEEVAYFSFGSTVVLLFPKGMFRLREGVQVPKEVKMGEPLGNWII